MTMTSTTTAAGFTIGLWDPTDTESPIVDGQLGATGVVLTKDADAWESAIKTLVADAKSSAKAKKTAATKAANQAAKAKADAAAKVKEGSPAARVRDYAAERQARMSMDRIRRQTPISRSGAAQEAGRAVLAAMPKTGRGRLALAAGTTAAAAAATPAVRRKLQAKTSAVKSKAAVTADTRRYRPASPYFDSGFTKADEPVDEQIAEEISKIGAPPPQYQAPGAKPGPAHAKPEPPGIGAPPPQYQKQPKVKKTPAQKRAKAVKKLRKKAITVLGEAAQGATKYAAANPTDALKGVGMAGTALAALAAKPAAARLARRAASQATAAEIKAGQMKAASEAVAAARRRLAERAAIGGGAAVTGAGIGALASRRERPDVKSASDDSDIAKGLFRGFSVKDPLLASARTQHRVFTGGAAATAAPAAAQAGQGATKGRVRRGLRMLWEDPKKVADTVAANSDQATKVSRNARQVASDVRQIISGKPRKPEPRLSTAQKVALGGVGVGGLALGSQLAGPKPYPYQRY